MFKEKIATCILSTRLLYEILRNSSTGKFRGEWNKRSRSIFVAMRASLELCQWFQSRSGLLKNGGLEGNIHTLEGQARDKKHQL
jgi:hypothetical protein